MTYLSQLRLNHRDKHVRDDLADCQHLHRTVLSAFPDVSDSRARESFQVLYRVELGGRPTLLLQSNDQPDWSRLPVGYVSAKPECKSLDPAYSSLRPGQPLLFRLRANPTKRLRAEQTPDKVRWAGKRVELQTEEKQVAWLRRKGEDGGFELLSVQARPDLGNVRTIPEAKLHGRRGDARLTFGSVLFEGMLRISDVDRFRDTLQHGVGSGKAYGFGLLSIAPAR